MIPKKDYGLILSLGIIIAVASYWFVKEMPTENIEYYMDELGDKLMAMVPQNNNKQALGAVYDDFKEKVREKQIQPEKVEEFAAAIINLSNSMDTLSAEEAEALMEIAATAVIAPPPPKKGIVYHPAKPEEWERLNKRLESVHELEKKLKEHQNLSEKKARMEFRVDENLNVILDSKVRESLKKEEVLHRLEQEKRVVWMDNMTKSLEDDLKRIEVELNAIGEESAEKNLIRLKILARPIFEKGMVMIDSLHLMTEINWDSISHVIDKNLDKEEVWELMKEKDAPSEADNE